MKTRDELAEAFAMELLRRPRSEQLASGVVSDAFAYADAFVAERERRAAVVPVDKATLQLDYDQANVIALALGYDASALPLGQAIEKIKVLASRPPAQTPVVESLLFTEDGTARGPNGMALDMEVDGCTADARDGEAWVCVRAKDQPHAERIVAAMLPVGRGTK